MFCKFHSRIQYNTTFLFFFFVFADLADQGLCLVLILWSSAIIRVRVRRKSRRLVLFFNTVEHTLVNGSDALLISCRSTIKGCKRIFSITCSVYTSCSTTLLYGTTLLCVELQLFMVARFKSDILSCNCDTVLQIMSGSLSQTVPISLMINSHHASK